MAPSYITIGKHFLAQVVSYYACFAVSTERLLLAAVESLGSSVAVAVRRCHS